MLIDFAYSPSGIGTYNVNEGQDWVFLQLDERGKVLESFCSCSADTLCSHIQASIDQIFGKHLTPLHVRFIDSFWHQFTFFLFETYGEEIPEGLIHSSLSFQKQAHTLENSIKFSNLDEEEIERWKQGIPSSFLRYTLSSWCDLASYLIQHAETEIYEVSFQVNEKAHLLIQFPDIKIETDLSKSCFEDLYPSLSLVHSKPQVIDQYLEQFKDLRFDPKNKIVPREDIELLLKEHLHLAKTILKDYSFEPVPRASQYRIEFLPTKQLLVEEYLETPGDIEYLFGDWAFSHQTFYRIDSRLFQSTTTLIPQEKIGGFVSKHRHFLSSFPGFTPHLAGAEERLSYAVDFKSGKLSFIDTVKTHIDCGEWLFIEGHGFFPKSERALRKIKSGLTLEKRKVSDFIDENSDELQHISFFFCRDNRLLSLHVNVKEGKNLQLEPTFTFEKPIDSSKILLFQRHLFIPKRGFIAAPESLYPLLDLLQKQEIHKDVFLEHPAFHLNQENLSLPASLAPLSERSLLVKTFSKGGLAEVVLETERGQIPLAEIATAFKKRRSFVYTREGFLSLKDKSLSFIKSLQVEENGYVTFTPLEWFRLEAEGKIKLAEGVEPFPLDEKPSFSSMLRSYQIIGASWLFKLYKLRLGGLLCDDMGLGKTHQVMALLENAKAPFLIVCPTSVITHWEDRLKKVLPQLSCYVHHGLHRKHDLPNADIIVTSYGILRQDISLFEKQSFEIAIFDEIQVAKNRKSRTFEILHKLQVGVKFGLTGTPIENHLQELWTLLKLVLPSLKTFSKEYYSPFVLRRKKQDVLDDLPEKIEQIATSTFSEDQKELYQRELALFREPLVQELDKELNAKNYLHVFTLLTHLKQICSHPAVFLKTPSLYQNYGCGKWDLFKDLLAETLLSGQKLVIFTQFLDMLKIFSLYLQEQKINYALVKGDTTHRAKEIEKFQNDENCKVFLGSLHATSYGIDLTQGSVVIHYDRWWTKAKENQATDRVHRIGQTRGVQVFKLVTKDSLEERIDALIQEKEHLMHEFVDGNHPFFLKELTREELLTLLKGL